jgi:hypothetical protein
MKNFYFRWATSTFFGASYQKEFSAEWDAALNRLIDKHWQTVNVGEHYAVFGQTKVWIGNAFYAYGFQYDAGLEFRPSLRTMRRLDSLVNYSQQKSAELKRAAYDTALRDLGR